MRKTIRAALAAAALATCGQAFAQSLEARDINLDGITDAYYDTGQNITWLADAGLAASQGLNGGFGPGLISWQQATAWAAQLDVYSVTGWRLPVSYVPDLDAMCANATGNLGACVGMVRFETEGTRMSSYADGASFLNTGGGFWTGNLYQGALGGNYYVQGWSFGSAVGWYTDEVSVPLSQAWAVHDGDVAPVPEPSTYALMLAGLGAVCLARRRRARD